MNSQILTYVLFVVPLLIVIWDIYQYNKNKKNGVGFVFKPLKLIACVIVMILALVAIVTGQTYDDISQKISQMF